MRKRIKLKRKFPYGNISNMDKIILLIVIIVITIFFVMRYVNRKVSPVLLNYAKIEAEKLSTLIASSSVNKELIQKLNVDNLFITTKNSDGKILTIDFDPMIVNEMLATITSSIQYNLKKIEEGDIENLSIDQNALLNYDKNSLTKGIFYYIPAGVVFNNTLLANIGPRVPIKFNLIGNVIANVESNVKNYGLNNALIEVSVNVKITEKIILPIMSDVITVDVTIPIAIKLVQGTVPEYYYNGNLRNSEVGK